MVAPILKWAGGKRWLAPQICPPIAARLKETGGTYYEPFLGGGAIALALEPWVAVLADVNVRLIELYQVLAEDPWDPWVEGRENGAPLVWRALQWLARCGVTREAYLLVRDLDLMQDATVLQLGQLAQEMPYGTAYAAYWRAAQFLYWNRVGFNGMYRENSAGKFNIPYGRPSASALADPESLMPTQEALVAVGQVLGKPDVEIRAQGFEQTLVHVQAGDVIYADPPYIDTFTSYSSQGFGLAQQEHLAQLLQRADQQGAFFVASNSYNETVQQLYQFAHVIEIQERYSIAARGSARKETAAALITNDLTLLGR